VVTDEVICAAWRLSGGEWTERGWRNEEGSWFHKKGDTSIFMGEWEKFVFNAFADLEPVQRSEDGCDMWRFRSFNHSTCKTVLSLLETVYLRLRKIVVERVTVVEFEVDNRGIFVVSRTDKPTDRIAVSLTSVEFIICMQNLTSFCIFVTGEAPCLSTPLMFSRIV